MSDETEELAEAVRVALKGLKTQDARVDAMVELFAERQAESLVWEVYPVAGRHAAVETVEIYGLTIGIDANGRASQVAFDEGAEFDG